MANILRNNGLSTLRMQDSTTDNFPASLNIETLPQRKSAFSKIKNFAKNMFLAGIAAAQILLTAMSFVELLSILTVYFVPLAVVGIISILSKSFRDFVTRVFRRIQDTTFNSIRIASILLALPLLMTGFRSIFGLSKLSGAFLPRVADMNTIETVIAISLAIASSVASVFSRTVNKILGMFGLVTEATTQESLEAEDEDENAFLRFGGVIFSIVAAARFLPNMLFGLAAPSIVVGLGLAAAESVADCAENQGNDNYIDPVGYTFVPQQKHFTCPSSPPIHFEEAQRVEIPVATAIPLAGVAPGFDTQQPRETQWTNYRTPSQPRTGHHYYYDSRNGFLDGLFAGMSLNRQSQQPAVTQNVFVGTQPTRPTQQSTSWQFPANSLTSAPPVQTRQPAPVTSTSTVTHPLQEQRAIGFTNFIG